jgi:hypothetical protein
MGRLPLAGSNRARRVQTDLPQRKRVQVFSSPERHRCNRTPRPISRAGRRDRVPRQLRQNAVQRPAVPIRRAPVRRTRPALVPRRRPAALATDRAEAPPALSRSSGRRRLLYCDHVDHEGERLFRLVCQHDLEGIVAKHKHRPYLPEHTKWLKIRNRDYSQWIGRKELFQRERSSPDVQHWDSCTLACAGS